MYREHPRYRYHSTKCVKQPSYIRLYSESVLRSCSESVHEDHRCNETDDHARIQPVQALSDMGYPLCKLGVKLYVSNWMSMLLEHILFHLSIMRCV